MSESNGGQVQSSRLIREQRIQNADPTEPLNTETRRLNRKGAGNSLYVNLTQFGAKVHDLEGGQEVTVETFQDCIIIMPADLEESDR